MSKTCPSCGYRPIGPFTDNCPICAEPVRNVRSDGGGFGGFGGFRGFGGMSNVVKWVVGGALVAVLGVAGCCGLGMWQMGTAIKDAQKEMERMQAEEAERRAKPVV